MKQLLPLLFACITSIAVSQPKHNIIPAPASVQLLADAPPFTVRPTTAIVVQHASLLPQAQYLQQYLQRYYKRTLAISNAGNEANNIVLTINKVRTHGTEGYELAITPNKVVVTANAGAGIFYGIQSLIQLIPTAVANNIIIPSLTVNDAPRFTYRGMHLDVSRHFYDVTFIKKYIDWLALHKFNFFHWHLTDDQGWRIEIKKYPKLTTVGATRNGTIVGNYPGTANTNRKHSGYYTQAQVKEIVRYAAARFITVVPEIEMPGHASAAIAAYPKLSCFPNEPTKIQHPSVWNGNTKGKQVQQTWGVFEDVFAPTDATFKFLQDVLDEVMALFPSKYIHIGGDECPKESWKRSTFCQELMKAKGLKDEHELQSYFIQRIEKHVNAKGRTIIGWDEILEGGLAPNAIVMSWRGEEGGIEAAKQNHQVIMTPGGWCYFDHSQSPNEDSVTIGGFTPIEKVYSYEPVPAALNETQSQLVLGAQANVWTEYITNESKLAYMVFPRMAALSEVLWSPKAQRNWPHFEQRLTQQFQRYKLWNINYSKAYFELNDSISVTSDGLLWHLLPPKGKHNIQFSLLPQGNATPNFQPYTVPLLINQSYSVQAINTADGKPYPSITRNFNINKATGRAVQILRKPSKSYPGKYGALTLVNGLTANGKRSHPEWMGFSGGSVEIVIDFGEPVTISKLGVSTLHYPTSWVHTPADVSWQASLTANDWQPLQPTTRNEQGTVVTITPQQLQYLKIKLSAVDAIPAGLPGAGKPAWLFLDEIFAD